MVYHIMHTAIHWQSRASLNFEIFLRDRISWNFKKSVTMYLLDRHCAIFDNIFSVPFISLSTVWRGWSMVASFGRSYVCDLHARVCASSLCECLTDVSNACISESRMERTKNKTKNQTNFGAQRIASTNKLNAWYIFRQRTVGATRRFSFHRYCNS